MADTVLVQARVPVELKNSTDPIFQSMGIDTATGIRMFLAQVRLHNGLPFVSKADPFYSEENMRHLRRSIDQIRKGQIVEHDLIEVGDSND